MGVPEAQKCWDKVGNRQFKFFLGNTSGPSSSNAAPYGRKLRMHHQDGKGVDNEASEGTRSRIVNRNLLQSRGSKSPTKGKSADSLAAAKRTKGFDYGVYNPTESLHVVQDASQPRLRKVKDKNLAVVAGVMLNQKRKHGGADCSTRFHHLASCNSRRDRYGNEQSSVTKHILMYAKHCDNSLPL